MPVRLTDEDISRLLLEPKPLPQDYLKRFQVRQKHGHGERDLDICGMDGSDFRIILRQSNFNPLDFSVILAYHVPKTNQVFRLRRYNGKSHQHTNSIERQNFYDFHIHKATERYQGIDRDEETFAEPSNRFSDINTAITCLIQDCAFALPTTEQCQLFGPEEK